MAWVFPRHFFTLSSMQLNPDQQRAVECNDNCLIVACPGSGKTRLVVQKCARLLRLNPSEKIILVSFTRDSVAELRHRIATELRSNIPATCVIATFDSLAIRQLRRSYAGSTFPKLIMGDLAHSYFLRAFKRAGRKDFKSQDEAYRIFQQLNTQMGLVADPKSAEGKLYRRYKESLVAHNLIDMPGVHQAVVEGLFTGAIPTFGASHMMIDEFQDVDRYQYEWIMCHRNAGVKITAVGDDDQSIYAFRNALGVQGMNEFRETPGTETIFLSINYRCKNEIVGYAESIITAADDRIPKKLLASRGEGGIVNIASYLHGSSEAESVCSAITSILASEGLSEPRPGMFGVLARTNDLLDACEAKLTAAGIPVRRASGDSIWESKPVCFFLNFLDSLATGGGVGIDQVLSYAFGYSKDMDEVHRQIGTQTHLLLSEETKLDLTALSQRGQRVMESFSEGAPLWKSYARSEDKDAVDHAINLASDWLLEHCTGQADPVLLRIASESLTDRFSGTLRERLGKIRFMIGLKGGDKGGVDGFVYLTTMHGSKGLEFNHVWLISVNDQVIPSPRSPIADELRLFYVAATRAKDALYISYTGKASSFIAPSDEESPDPQGDEVCEYPELIV